MGSDSALSLRRRTAGAGRAGRRYVRQLLATHEGAQRHRLGSPPARRAAAQAWGRARGCTPRAGEGGPLRAVGHGRRGGGAAEAQGVLGCSLCRAGALAAPSCRAQNCACLGSALTAALSAAPNPRLAACVYLLQVHTQFTGAVRSAAAHLVRVGSQIPHQRNGSCVQRAPARCHAPPVAADHERRPLPAEPAVSVEAATGSAPPAPTSPVPAGAYTRRAERPLRPACAAVQLGRRPSGRLPQQGLLAAHVSPGAAPRCACSAGRAQSPHSRGTCCAPPPQPTSRRPS